MKKKLLLSCIMIYIFPIIHYGQQDSQFTQYMYNTASFNPAYAGSRGVLSIMGLYRTQWVGLDGAPNTQTLTINSPINDKKNRLGVGMSIINDAIGAINETNFNASVSYTIPVSNENKLRFGVNAGGNLLNIDLVTLRRFDAEDTLLQNDISNRFSPSIGFGFYYHNNNLYAGFSIPNFLETDHFNKGILSDIDSQVSVFAKERINYYLIAGYVYEIMPYIKFKPAILTKLTAGSPVQVDMSANFLFNDKFTLGTSYRWSKAFSAIAGFQVSESLMIGFSYDREISELGKSSVNNGSFEAIMRFELKKVYHKFLTPRFF